MPGRVVGEVASDLEQKRNDIVGDVENTLHVHAEKGPERGRHQGDADGCTRAMRGASRDPGGPSLSRLAPPSQLLALHQLPQRTQVLCNRHGSVVMEDDGPSGSTGRLRLLRRGK